MEPYIFLHVYFKNEALAYRSQVVMMNKREATEFVCVCEYKLLSVHVVDFSTVGELGMFPFRILSKQTLAIRLDGFIL